MSLKRSRLKSGSKTLARRTRLSPVTKDQSRRRRNKAQKDVEYARTEAGDFSQFVRDQGCVVLHSRREWGRNAKRCYGPIEAAHLWSRGAHPGESGLGRICGLCRQHHRDQHSWTIAEFNAIYAADLFHEAVVLQNRWIDGDR